MLVEIIKRNNLVFPKEKKFQLGKYKMNELTMVFQNSYFKILDSDSIYNKYVDNKKVVWDIKRITRKMESLAKYWLIMQALTFHFTESRLDGKEYYMSDKDYHAIMKAKFLPELIINTKFGEYRKASVSFENMKNEDDFRAYLYNVVNYISELGYDVEELIKTM